MWKLVLLVVPHRLHAINNVKQTASLKYGPVFFPFLFNYHLTVMVGNIKNDTMYIY